MDFLKKRCVPCEGGTLPLSEAETGKYLKEIPGWQVGDDRKKIFREFRFRDFKEAMVFINKVAEIAENEGHHPDLHVFYNRVKIELWTHAVKGLTENDFIIAAKINSI